MVPPSLPASPIAIPPDRCFDPRGSRQFPAKASSFGARSQAGFAGQSRIAVETPDPEQPEVRLGVRTKLVFLERRRAGARPTARNPSILFRNRVPRRAFPDQTKRSLPARLLPPVEGSPLEDALRERRRKPRRGDLHHAWRPRSRARRPNQQQAAIIGLGTVAIYGIHYRVVDVRERMVV